MLKIDNPLDTFNIDEPVYYKIDDSEYYTECEVLDIITNRNGIFVNLCPAGATSIHEEINGIEIDNVMSEEEHSLMLEEEEELKRIEDDGDEFAKLNLTLTVAQRKLSNLF